MASTGSPFTTNPQLTGVVIAYRNAELIADRVLPRIGPAVPNKEFRYLKYDFAQDITLPDARVGRKGTPNQVEFMATETRAVTADYGLTDIVPNDDIKQAPPGYDPLANAAEKTMNLVDMIREKRVADLVFAASTYPAANVLTLSGTSQWSSATSTPVNDVLAAKDAMVMDPNIMVIGRPAWTKLRTNPQILSSISFSGTSNGVATLRAVADLLELEEIIVGAAWLNAAKRGQTTSLGRIWGKHAALLRRDKLAKSLNDTPTFGWTAEYDTRLASTRPVAVGLRGGVEVLAGESVAEVIGANDLGYFIQNAVA